MIMRIPPSSSSRPQPSATGNSATPPDATGGAGATTASAKTNQMREALNNYILNNGINDMQKKTNKTEQTHKKNVAKQKEKKAESDAEDQ